MRRGQNRLFLPRDSPVKESLRRALFAPMNGGPALRFDDTLETVMAADLGSPQATQSAWRQLVDLIGRRRAAADADAMATLRAIRDKVPLTVRAASARALEFADPPAALVRLFATDDLTVALPVLRNARMDAAEWTELLPHLAPAARGLLRNRRDLGPVVKRALEAFGPIDFVLSDSSATAGQGEDLSFVALAGSASVLSDLAPDPNGHSEVADAAVQSGTDDPVAVSAAIAPASPHLQAWRLFLAPQRAHCIMRCSR